MTITTFNYEGSYLPGLICNIVVKADLGRWTPTPCEWRKEALNTATPNLADEPTLADGPPSPPSVLRIDPLNTATPNLADEPTLADGLPSESRIDVLNTATPHFADTPTLPMLLTSSGQEWQFRITTDIRCSRMAISHCY